MLSVGYFNTTYLKQFSVDLLNRLKAAAGVSKLSI